MSESSRERGGSRSQISHVITGLNVGGAETMLLRLLTAIDLERFRARVLSLLKPGALSPLIRALGVPLETAGMRRGLPGLSQSLRLLRFARARADIVQGWMYHGCLAATLVRWRMSQRPALAWSIHHSLSDLALEPTMTQRVIRLLARFSKNVEAIVYCSRVSREQHEALGFDGRRALVIPNGFDLSLFRPDESARARLLTMTQAPAARPHIAVIGRVDPMKDHGNAIRAAALLKQRGIEAQFVFMGRGADAADRSLSGQVRDAGLADRVSFLGLRGDVPSLLPGFDLLVVPSAWGEAFPLVVGEAMACGVPCVVTDVGDSAWLVGDTGLVVPPGDASALAGAVKGMLSLDRVRRAQLGEAARARIAANFALETMASRFEDLYLELEARRLR